jgi:hypothetical protein
MPIMTTTIAPSPATPAKRPVGATVVVFIAVAAAALFFWNGASLVSDADGDRSDLGHGLLQLGLGVLALVVCVGALGVRAWAWKLFMVWAVIGLTTQILRHFFFDDAFYLGMALNVVAVLALTPRDVQVAFGIKEPPTARLDLPTRNPLDRD